jgi:hypothetical protein
MDNPKKDRSINSKHTPSLKPSNSGFKGMLVKDKETDVSLYYTVDCNIKAATTSIQVVAVVGLIGMRMNPTNL